METLRATILDNARMRIIDLDKIAHKELWGGVRNHEGLLAWLLEGEILGGRYPAYQITGKWKHSGDVEF